MAGNLADAIKDFSSRKHLEDSAYYHSLEKIGVEAQQTLKQFIGECISDKPLG